MTFFVGLHQSSDIYHVRSSWSGFSKAAGGVGRSLSDDFVALSLFGSAAAAAGGSGSSTPTRLLFGGVIDVCCFPYSLVISTRLEHGMSSDKDTSPDVLFQS
jgi:hypothetical protein